MPFRENTATSEVVALSNNSTVSDFNPDQDALMSPQRPNPRRAGSHGVVKAQNQFVHLDKNLDYAIDTSALRAALPEFSDGTSSGDEEEDVSIEIGRGARDRNYRLDDSRDSFMSLEDSRISGSPAGSRSGNRPALRNISNRTALRNSDALRRDAQIRRASLVAQKENINPKATKPKGNPTSGTQKGSKQHRRTLSEMHARVSETYDGSYLSDERPPNGYVTSKTTRFGNSKPYSQHKITLAVKNAAAGGKADNGWTEHSNHESFLLPDVENLSELVSGIYHDGMAVNAQPKRPRTTRFTSPPAVEMPNPNTDTHAHFDAVPIPADEKALFASLRLLQRKVLSLEKTNEEAEDQLERLRRENTILRADPLRQNRYESDDEEPPRGGAASLAVVKGRLEAAIAALRNQLETANHKVSGQESVIQKATEERNSVINQLGSVYLTCEELRADNQTLRRENSHLKAQLVGLMAGPEGYELGTKHRREPTEPRKDQTRPMEEKGNTHHATHTTQPRLDVRESQGHDLPPRRDDAARQTGTEKNEQYEALFSLGAHSSRPVDYKRSKSESGEKKLPNTGRQRTKRVSGNGGDATDYSIIDTRNIQIQTLTQDLTHLTFIDVG
jgi:regulator of replication initiation timing